MRVRPPRALALAIPASAFLVSALVASRGDGPAGWEVPVARRLWELPSWTTPALKVAMQSGTRLAVIVVALGVLLGGRRRVAAVIAGSGFAAWGLALIAKHVVDRPRPDPEVFDGPLRAVVSGPGFPSTHAAVAMGLALAVVLTVHPERPLTARLLTVGAISVALLTAVARVHLGVHWPLDVIGGAAIGAVCAVGASALVSARDGKS